MPGVYDRRIARYPKTTHRRFAESRFPHERVSTAPSDVASPSSATTRSLLPGAASRSVAAERNSDNKSATRSGSFAQASFTSPNEAPRSLSAFRAAWIAAAKPRSPRQRIALGAQEPQHDESSIFAPQPRNACNGHPPHGS